MARPSFGLVCYTVSDSSESEDDAEEIPGAETAVKYVIDHILQDVCHGLRDFSDMYIKQEPAECEEWDVMVVGQEDYRNQPAGVAVKMESDSSDDSDDESSSSSSEEESAPDIADKPEVEQLQDTEGVGSLLSFRLWGVGGW
jgi:hypothetical protein